ncbi:diguanylate cyclase [Kineosporia sp. A_224]|uniref:GGDEF domain-containing protein n=1 Tax=Kineosporia sp. A_224 TaxID=1962180 RepID=UPI00117AFFCD|nr:sensor domain-containing diguanylate cyclase [Kineosporia sp. A_224]
MRARRNLTAAVAAAVVAGVALLPTAGPAAAHQVSRASVESDAGDGIVALQSEVLALVALGVWPDPVPQRLQDVHDEYASYVDGLDRRALVAWVLSADADGARVLERLRAGGGRTSPAEVAALGPLRAQDRTALREGRPPALLPEDYVRALDELEDAASGVEPAPAGTQEPGTPGPAGLAVTASTSAPATTPATTPASAPASSPTAAPATPAGTERPGTGLPVAALGPAAALALVAASAVALRRRRRPAGTVLSARHVVGLLDAGRLLGDARDVAGVAQVAVAELAKLLRVEAAVLLAADGRGGGRRQVLADPRGCLDGVPEPVTGLLARVAATGQASLEVLDDDPCLGDRAVLAVPVLAGGEVVAVLAAVRPAGQPFGVHELRVATELAPLVASALHGAAALETVRTQATRDALTGLPNRRSLDLDLRAEVELHAGRTTAVVMVDVDHFKKFNDREGHAAGDAALQAVARVLAAAVRDQDGAYRYGGEEFCLLVRQVTEAEVRALLDRVLDAVRAVDVPGAAAQPAGHLSVSAGVALVETEDAAVAVLRADEALYRAKELGRDRYAVAPPLAGPAGARPPAADPAEPDPSDRHDRV